ncbi:MAG: type II toxin-antitoxin system HicB family antitoxin [Vulcanimicrobiaceae bacterium]
MGQGPDADTYALAEALGANLVYHHAMARQFQVFLEYDPNERAWVTCVPALDHLSTFGPTREEALASTREAIRGYLEAAKIEGIRIPPAPALAELVQIAL